MKTLLKPFLVLLFITVFYSCEDTDNVKPDSYEVKVLNVDVEPLNSTFYNLGEYVYPQNVYSSSDINVNEWYTVIDVEELTLNKNEYVPFNFSLNIIEDDSNICYGDYVALIHGELYTFNEEEETYLSLSTTFSFQNIDELNELEVYYFNENEETDIIDIRLTNYTNVKECNSNSNYDRIFSSSRIRYNINVH